MDRTLRHMTIICWETHPAAGPGKVLPEFFLKFGLYLDRPLYKHQEMSILKALAGDNMVVSTGTGDGGIIVPSQQRPHKLKIVGTSASYVNKLIRRDEGVVNNTFVKMLEALGYDIDLHYVKREE